uniref:Putative polyprotein n=1 Tax=Albugo laibachii Nc14 TaxID=890382 RepID=F0X0S7_9STRA|nr:putative polyprotein [Albugo laibachii Nc14]|eukprot:CCA27371.1 putative polyprotein [Albugo laibachii Nc14]
MDHMMKFDKLTMEMAAMGDGLNDQEMLVILLGSLPLNFDPIVRILENITGIDLMSAKETPRREWGRIKNRESSEVTLEVTRGRISKKKYQRNPGTVGEEFNGKCFQCGKRGHRKYECRTRLQQVRPSSKPGDDSHAFMAVAHMERNNWLLDSGAHQSR